MQIEVTQEQWDNRNVVIDDNSPITKAYSITGLDWEGYSILVDDDNMYIFFIKNELEYLGLGDVVAAWVEDDSMVVGVKVIING